MDEKKALIVEDDKEIAQVISLNIEDLGLVTKHISNGKEALDLFKNQSFDLLVLDLMLPGMDGISLCTKIREKDKEIPILMVTAKSDEIDRVLGLELGADDYLTKPFSILELKARVKALLRRSSNKGKNSSHSVKNHEITHCDLYLNEEKRLVTLKDSPIDLTVKEFELLLMFMKNPGRAFTRSELLNLVWGYQFQGYEHTVNTHINRLRKKIEEDPAKPQYIETLWGVGYRLSEGASK